MCGAGLDQPGHVTRCRILATGELHQKWCCKQDGDGSQVIEIERMCVFSCV